MAETIAGEFAEYCVALRPDDLDAADREYVRKLLLDTLGTAVGGVEWSDSARTVLETARGLDSGGDATVLGTGERLSPENAAFANGALSHSLDYDNRHSAGSLHIGSSVVPAALAAGEDVDADGETLFTGVVAGYDVAARLGMACNPRSSHERGFHPTGACGTFAATAAAGVVYGLGIDEFVAAFGLNGSQASGGYQCSISGGWNKRFHPGLAARDAFLAIEAAKNGFRGPPDPIEGELGFLNAYADRPRPDRATDGLGERYEAARTKIKPYPVGTFAHVPIALLIDLATEHDIDPTRIESVTVELPTSGAEMFGRDPEDGHPTTSAEAQFDAPFAAALALVRREATLNAFHDALTSGDETFERVMAVTDTVASDDMESALPERYPARVAVRTPDATYESAREWVHGEPDHPMSWDDLTVKFGDLAPAFDDGDIEELVARVRAVESVTARDVTAAVRAGLGD